jgi:Fe-S-cluster containining protein
MYSLLEPLGRSPVMRKIRDTCLQYRCVKCCLNREMPLSSSDIRQMRSLGFSKSFFIVKRNGKRQLKNSAGRRIFHNGRRCTIYNDRPEGCRLYPIILCEDTGETALDSYFPHHGKFQVTPSISREVIKLVRKLDVETKRGLRSGED